MRLIRKSPVDREEVNEALRAILREMQTGAKDPRVDDILSRLDLPIDGRRLMAGTVQSVALAYGAVTLEKLDPSVMAQVQNLIDAAISALTGGGDTTDPEETAQLRALCVSDVGLCDIHLSA